MGQCSVARHHDTHFVLGGTACASRIQDRDDQPTSGRNTKDSNNLRDSPCHFTTLLAAREQQQQQRRPGTERVLQVIAPQNNHAAPAPVSPLALQLPLLQWHAVDPPSSQSPQPVQRDASEGFPRVSTPHWVTRRQCYQLNLDSELEGSSRDLVGGTRLCQLSHDMPPLTYNASEDSAMTDPTSVAIRTAQIFREITVAKDGTILSQNARASQSDQGNKITRCEKSRQAVTIDKVKYLVEESLLTGKAPHSDKPANLASLFIIGEYDEFSYLVRDGSVRLRKANGQQQLGADRYREMGCAGCTSVIELIALFPGMSCFGVRTQA